MKIHRLSIVIPFYNEEENVENVISNLACTLENNSIDYEIIAVNNGSYDKTGSILNKLKSSRVVVVEVEKNMGFGHGIIRGLEKSEGEYVGYMWGDNQISAETAVKVFKKLVDEDLDLCKIKRSSRDYGLFRKIESAVYNRIFIRMFFGKMSNDINGSPKLMKRSLYKRLNVISQDWFIDTEIMAKCKYFGANVGEVDAIYERRMKGKSKVRLSVVFEFLRNIINFKSNFIKTL